MEYEIQNIQVGALTKSSFFSLIDKYQKVVILIDENTKPLIDYLQLSQSLLNKAIIIQIKSGEENKNLTTSSEIWRQLNDNQVNRNDLFINLGGGVITDMGGFTASTFKRGMNFINIPTTLLAMVDASIGGKTGIDFYNFKNQIGISSDALAIFCDSHFLSTLPKKELVSGFAEVLKHGLVKDKEYWNLCTETLFSQLNWDEIIAGSIAIKSDIVLHDPNEKGERKLLNFGHTIGHAIETFMMNQKTPILHGEAVAAGMICESYLSVKSATLSPEELKEITKKVSILYSKIEINKASFYTLIDLMKNDKKNISEEINFSLLASVGNGIINKSCSEEIIKEALQYYIAL